MNPLIIEVPLYKLPNELFHNLCDFLNPLEIFCLTIVSRFLTYVFEGHDCTRLSNYAADLAAQWHNLDFFKWFIAYQGRAFDSKLFESAAAGGRIHNLVWLREMGCMSDTRAQMAAAYRGHVHVLEWMGIRQTPVSSAIGFYAAKGNQGHVVEFLRSIQAPIDAQYCAGAAKGGHLPLLKQLRARGYPWDIDTCSGAASGGHLEILQYAFENNCPRGMYTAHCAAANGHFHVLKWLSMKHCPLPLAAWSSAIIRGHYEIAEWLFNKAITNGPAFITTQVVNDLTGRVLAWVIYQGYAHYFEHDLALRAAATCNWVVVDWTKENMPRSYANIVPTAREEERRGILNWALKHDCPDVFGFD